MENINWKDFLFDPTKDYEPHHTITPEKSIKRDPCNKKWVYNKDWEISPKGDLVGWGYYWITSDRLNENDWILHLMEKAAFDANTFIPAYFEACRRAGIKEITIITHY